MALHPALRRFVDEMQKRLDEQMPTKGDLGWRGPGSLSFDSLSIRVESHKHEAMSVLAGVERRGSITQAELDKIIHDLTDAANYIMMIADKLRMEVPVVQ